MHSLGLLANIKMKWCKEISLSHSYFRENIQYFTNKYEYYRNSVPTFYKIKDFLLISFSDNFFFFSKWMVLTLISAFSLNSLLIWWIGLLHFLNISCVHGINLPCRNVSSFQYITGFNLLTHWTGTLHLCI